jgi:hypothetical protein
MKYITLFALLVLSAAMLPAQTKPAATPKPALPSATVSAPAAPPPASSVKPALPPLVPLDLKYKIIKAKSQADAAQMALEHTLAFQAAQALSATWAGVIQEFQKFCGDNFNPTLDSDGEPVCVVKPAQPPVPPQPRAPAPLALHTATP